MATTTPEKTTPPIFDIQSPLDLAKMNVAGVQTVPAIKQAWEGALNAQEKLAKDLEERYSKPNWFKVAAGFAKPQLGGFLASLGSAGAALGEYEENRRAIQPTISRMRAQIEAGRIPLAQRTEQQRLFEEWQAAGGTDTKKGAEIVNLDPTSPTAAAVKSRLEQASSIAGTASTQQATSAREQELMRETPYYIPQDMHLAKNWQQHATQQNQIFKNALVNSGLFNAEQVAGMTPARLQSEFDAVNKQQAEKRLTDATQSGQVLSNSMNALSNLYEARNLATSEGMEKLLGLGAGQDAVSALFGYVSNSDQGSYSRLAEAARKLSQSDPNLYSKFVVLQKALNTNVAQARELVQNPSNQATGLLQSTYPNAAMPQKSIVTLLDLMAAQNMRDSQIAALRQSERYRDVNPNVFESSRDFQSINENLKKQKSDIAEGKYYGKKAPGELYNVESIFKNTITAPQRAPAAPAAATTPGSSTTKRPRLGSVDDIMKAAGVQ